MPKGGDDTGKLRRAAHVMRTIQKGQCWDRDTNCPVALTQDSPKAQQGKSSNCEATRDSKNERDTFRWDTFMILVQSLRPDKRS